MKNMQFTIYGQPIAKGRPRFARQGTFVKAYTPAKTRAYEASVHSQAFPHKPAVPWPEAIHLELNFYFSIPKGFRKNQRAQAELDTLAMPTKPDLENLIKSATDPLNGLFWLDDRQIVSLKASKHYSAKPRTEYLMIEHRTI